MRGGCPWGRFSRPILASTPDGASPRSCVPSQVGHTVRIERVAGLTLRVIPSFQVQLGVHDPVQAGFDPTLRGAFRVASSAVEHSAFNRLVLSSNLRRPISALVQDTGQNICDAFVSGKSLIEVKCSLLWH